MEHYREGQYDDDLTVGIDEYNEDIDTGTVDLFEYVGEDDSPLARLKSIILSIDWEITDDILRQFNEELQDLKGIWAGSKINLIYVQALEKLSRYIYKEKADAHPNTIKLLLTFYANLEKIVSSDSMSDQEKKKLLMEDVQRFEKLKKQIGRVSVNVPAQPVVEEKVELHHPEPSVVAKKSDTHEFSPALASESTDPDSPLINLKALVYGIDWEITERDLANLGKEVRSLEKKYQFSKAKLIFLRGIGALGAYINVKRSDAHADAFKLLHSFFVGFETVVENDLSGTEEKNILMPEVQKFNAFKAEIADTISPDAIARGVAGREEAEEEQYEDEIRPAFADMPEDVHGFREDEELAAMEKENVAVVVEESEPEPENDDELSEQQDQGEIALLNEMENKLSGMFTEPGREEIGNLDAEVALQGVDVESEADDDSDEEPLPVADGEFAPALASEINDTPSEESPAVLTEQIDDFFAEPDNADTAIIDSALVGVNVETEADDETEEEPLPLKDGELAPALSSTSDEGGVALEVTDQEDEGSVPDIDEHVDTFFSDSPETEDIALERDETITQPTDSDDETDSVETHSAAEIEDRFDDFFGTEDAAPPLEHAAAPLDGVDVETEADGDFDEDYQQTTEGEVAAMSDAVDDPDLAVSVEQDRGPEPGEQLDLKEDLPEEEIESVLADEIGVGELKEDDSQPIPESVDTDHALSGVDVETEDDDDSEEEPLPYEDNELAPALFTEDEEDAPGDEDSNIFEEQSDTIVAEQFDAFFGTEEQGQEEGEALTADSDEIEDQATDIDSEDSSLPDDDHTPALSTTEDVGDDLLSSALIEHSEEDHLLGEVVELEEIEEIPDEDVIALLDEDVPGPSSTEAPDLGDIEEISAEDVIALFGNDGDITEDQASAAILDYPEDELFGEAVDPDEIEEISDEDIETLFGEEATTVLSESEDVQDNTALLKKFNRLSQADDAPTITDSDESLVAATEGLGDATLDEDIAALFWKEAATVSTNIEEVQDNTALLEKFNRLSPADDAPFFTDPADNEETFAATEEEEVVFLPVDDDEDGAGGVYIEQPVVTSTHGNLNDLQNCIISLESEIEDNIMESLTSEIEKLRRSWISQPAQLTFLELLSTLTHHIEQLRYEADPEANKLLLSVFNKLEKSCLKESESSQILEALLEETTKVLQWQQRLIDEKTE